jgi:endo-1,4-beta-xylanase
MKDSEGNLGYSTQQLAVTRRHALRLLGTAAGASLIGGALSPATTVVHALENTLKDAAQKKGLLYGCATTKEHLTGDQAFASLLAKQCALLVPEADLKWKNLEPAVNQFSFETGDWLLNFARTHGLKMDGSVLVWHEALPRWFESLSPMNARAVLVNHIHKIVDHYKGKLQSWTVVNEAVAFRGSGELKDTPFLRLLGADYVDLAFNAAAEADPNVMLVYNDNHLEYDIPEDEYRRKILLKLLRGWRVRRIPIHALGIQSHLRTGNVPFSASKLREWLREVADLGYKIIISELDVIEKDRNTERKLRDKTIAAEIDRYLNAVLQERSVTSVITWGLSSRYTWLTKSFPRADGQPVRPLPYDADLKPTAVWQAINSAFLNAPGR